MQEMTIQQALELALSLHRAGRLGDAEQLYRRILSADPKQIEALRLLGVLANQAGKPELAVQWISSAISQGLATPDAYCNLGSALRRVGKLSGAIDAYRQAITLQPDFAEAHNSLGVTLKAVGQADPAIQAFEAAIALRPDFVDARSNLAVALLDAARYDEAIDAAERALSVKPDHVEAVLLLGNAQRFTGKLDLAVTTYRRAIAIRPGYAEAHFNLGQVLKDQRLIDQAITAFKRAFELKPDYADALINLAGSLKDVGLLDESLATFDTGIAGNPSDAILASHRLFTMLYHPGLDAHTLARAHREWDEKFALPLRHSMPEISVADRQANGRRLRIGYVSPDFSDHVVGRNLLPLFRHHDHARFEIVCYSNQNTADAIAVEFQQLADEWVNITTMSDAAVADKIRNDRIDILVDLTLHTGNHRLLVFARRPAPVQVTFAGYPGSTGLTAIDYRLSDPYLDPLGMDESVYSEKTIRLRDSFWCYDPLNHRDIQVGALPALASGCITFGSLNNFCKVNDTVLTLWSRVLRAVDHSRLLMAAPDGSARARTLDRLRRDGIDASRIDFVGHLARDQYLRAYHRIDIGLDTFPYNGHTTSLDSLWMGVPVITLVGQRVVSRAGWSQLSNLNLTELAADSPDNFVRIACELANDLPRLTNLRAALRPLMQQSPLMNADRFARSIESALGAMCGCAASPDSGRPDIILKNH
jgi:predicted O-linked N-acetylglucosamine transferase (SPINDLY family)